ncbi:hypothetical protein OAE96_01575 [Akkermansiaceae bacterium]|nr:hypothetical protein [Akkermansiaceae bacterium]
MDKSEHPMSAALLDSTVAERFLKKNCNDLSQMTSITDAAAELLSKDKRNLTLVGLTELSDAAAESLSKHKGTLSLAGLTELSDAAAESLSRLEWRLLTMNSPN